ncbi:MAG: hypothetical protein QFB86_04255 [Patescibacteria group bacterium]|nr:hypothetical protein [Patescibacteria group bacterium]
MREYFTFETMKERIIDAAIVIATLDLGVAAIEAVQNGRVDKGSIALGLGAAAIGAGTNIVDNLGLLDH